MSEQPAGGGDTQSALPDDVDVDPEHGEPTKVGDGADVTVDPSDLERGATPPATATSDATGYVEDGETQGGTGGLDAGGAG